MPHPVRPAIPERRPRLSQESYAPWMRAETLEDCHLFWMPVTGFPLTHAERMWLLDFATQMSEQMRVRHGLRAELFVEYKQLRAERARELLGYTKGREPLLGFARADDEDMSPLLTDEQSHEVLKQDRVGEPVEAPASRSLLWFPVKQPERQRELFAGEGCLATLFLPPDPRTEPPALPFTPALRAAHPAFQRQDVDGTIAALYAERDGFLEKSKQLIGKDLEDRPEYAAARFILPLPSASNFFKVTSEVRERWFQLAEVYLLESRPDAGLLLAFAKEDYLETLANVLSAVSASPPSPRAEKS